MRALFVRSYAFSLRVIDPSPGDFKELLGIQAGSAKSGRVHPGSAGNVRGISLDAAAVLDGKRLGRWLIEHLSEAVPDDGMSRPGLARVWRDVRDPRWPDRLVCDGQMHQAVCRQVGQSQIELLLEHRFSLARLTLFHCLAAAEDHVEARGQRR